MTSHSESSHSHIESDKEKISAEDPNKFIKIEYLAMDNISQSTPAHQLVTKETVPLINKPRRGGILLRSGFFRFVFVLLCTPSQLRCFLVFSCWRRWFAPRELKSRTVYIGSRYQTSEKQKHQVKNEIRNQVRKLLFFR